MKKVLLVLVSAFAPIMASAQFFGGQPNFGYVTSGVGQIYNLLTYYLIPVLMLAATGYFIYGVITYIKATDPSKKKEAQGGMVKGVIALAVIVSVWGIVALLQNIFGVQRGITAPNTVCPPGYTASGARCIPL